MKKIITGVILVLTMALVGIPQSVRVSADPAEDDIISTARESSKTDSFDYNPSQYIMDGYYWYATRLSLNKGEHITIKCGSQNDESIDMYITVYKQESDGTLSYVSEIDNDNYKGNGEKTTLDAEEDVTYYIVYGTYTSGLNKGNCHVEIEDLSGYKNITEVLGAAEVYSNELNTVTELGGGEKVFVSDVGVTYAKAYSFDAGKGDGCVAAIYNMEKYMDTVILLYYEDESGNIRYMFKHDNDNYLDMGELMSGYMPYAGRYYIVFAGFDDTVKGNFNVELNIFKCQDESLDFTKSDALPEHKDSDLWSWDNTGRTLTLKDGFCYKVSGEYLPAIILPEKSTIIVEGDACITSCSDCGIVCEGGLTIKGTSDNSSIHIESAYDAIYFDSDNIASTFNMSKCSLKMRAQESGFAITGDLNVEDSDIDIVASAYGIREREESADIIKIEFNNTKLSIQSRYSCIYMYCHSASDDDIVEIKDGDTYLRSTEDYGIYMNNGGYDSVGKTSVSGGRLIVDSNKSAIKAGYGQFNDLNFNLFTHYADGLLIDLLYSDGFSLPGQFRLYDENGKLLYEGEWNAEKVYQDYILNVDGVRAARAITVHDHTLGDWEYDETGHWKLCTDENCVSRDYGKSETYANHEFTILDNGDSVCECGYTIKSGTKPDDSIPGDDTEIPKDVKAGNGSTLPVWFGISAGVMLTAVVCIRRKKAIQ